MRSFYVASAAKHGQLESGPVAVSTVAVAAASRPARARIEDCLKIDPRFVVRTGTSPHQLVASADPSVLIFHCKRIAAGEIALVKNLRHEFPELQVIAVCESVNARTARRAVDSGAQGVVSADQLDAALPSTVAAVLAGQTAIPSELGAKPQTTYLSLREKQILAMVVMGFTNGEIAARLFLAESTVKSHLSSAFAKLGVLSRSEAAAIILDPQGSLGTGILAITSNAGASAA